MYYTVEWPLLIAAGLAAYVFIQASGPVEVDSELKELLFPALLFPALFSATYFLFYPPSHLFSFDSAVLPVVIGVVVLSVLLLNYPPWSPDFNESTEDLLIYAAVRLWIGRLALIVFTVSISLNILVLHIAGHFFTAQWTVVGWGVGLFAFIPAAISSGVVWIWDWVSWPFVAGGQEFTGSAGSLSETGEALVRFVPPDLLPYVSAWWWATCTVVLLYLAAFLARRGLRWRAALATVLLLKAGSAAFALYRPFWAETEGVSPLLFVPVPVALAIILLLHRAALQVEDLLIKAEDTERWSDRWRDRFVDRYGNHILAHSTTIQRRWLRRRRARVGWLLPVFAWLIMGESVVEVRSYLQKDREESRRQLRTARKRLAELEDL